MNTRDLENLYARTEKKFFNFWEDLLRYQSVGGDKKHEQDCRACAEWLCKQMQEMGLSIQLLETAGNPVACGRFKGEAGYPHVVFYGHYDVQPVEPLELWQSDPFEPVWRGDRLYARGAQDNKGQVVAFLQAVDALLSNGELKCSLTILLEGQEESGSYGLSVSLPEWKDWLKADVLIAMDTTMNTADTPAIMAGLRGLFSFELEVGGLKGDLHSGTHGGIVANPAVELSRLIASMYNPDGSIAIQGFYDGVEEPDAETLALIAKIKFDAEAYRSEVGVLPFGGELKYPAKLRNGLRPTLDVMGLTSGHQGAGVKTIIPAKAKAKMTSRLVVPQDPDYVFACIEKHVKKHVLGGLTAQVIPYEKANPVILDFHDSPLVQVANDVLAELFENEAVLEWSGASIPVISELVRVTEAMPLLVGFGLSEDQIHAPNESFSKRQFKAGFMFAAKILQKFV